MHLLFDVNSQTLDKHYIYFYIFSLHGGIFAANVKQEEKKGDIVKSTYVCVFMCEKKRHRRETHISLVE